jgi:hypothetical protein
MNLVEALEQLDRQGADANLWPVSTIEVVLSPTQEAARQNVLNQLAANPTATRAFVTRFEGDVLVVTIAIRGIGTGEVLIPAERFNPNSLDDYAALIACFECDGNA